MVVETGVLAGICLPSLRPVGPRQAAAVLHLSLAALRAGFGLWRFVVNYPLWNAFLTMLYFFVLVLWFILLFRVIMDIFRSHDMSGWGKAGWLIFVIILPFLGVFVYIIARGRKMAENDARDAAAAQDAFTREVQKAAGSSGSAADELAKLADLQAKGVISESEFAAQKAKLLG